MGPITIFDKSALQALSMDEAVWFDAFFSANLVPLFYVETLADLEKNLGEGKDPEALVAMLAEKTPASAFANVYHRKILLGELAGNEVAMAGQVMIDGGAMKKMQDGTIGLHLDEFPEQAALLRWREHDFLEIERTTAKSWRAELREQDPTRLSGTLENVLPSDVKISDLEQLKEFIDSFCSSNDAQVIALAFEIHGVPDDFRSAALMRWTAAGQPPLDKFLPYTTHVFKVDLLFYLGIQRGFISGDRASNRADMNYLYYLPFAMVFTSGDKLHRRTVPLFLGDDQSYLEVDDLKRGLGELDEHYSRLPEEIKELGVLAFVSYPPSEMDNVVTQLWDAYMRPDWREVAKAQEAVLGKPRDEGTDQATLADLKERLGSAQPATDDELADGGIDPNYFVTTRRTPATKGKWRMVSKEIENSEGEA